MVAEGGYEDIILVGHSFGALLVRAVWALANGAQPDASIDPSKGSSWSDRVRRIVLLAALGRGWQPTVALSPFMRLVYWLTGLWEFVLVLPHLLAFDHRRGAAFLTTVRLQSLALDNLARIEKGRPPSVVQVLGTIDDLVAPSDNIDLITGASFHYLEAARTGHLNVITPDTEARARVLRLAIAGDDGELAANAKDAHWVADLYSDAQDDFDQVLPPEHRRSERRPCIHRAVMVLHGIRDYGHWTKRLAGRIKERARDQKLECRTVTSSYGFFPMGPFLSPAVRRRRVEWFMDQYVHARALYPEAKFAFVGHSNGTYLLAGAIDVCPAVRFHRVVFAGSVVRTNFDWDQAVKRGQVEAVVNYVATFDWIVAGFPKFLGRLRFFDLGGAGCDGFRQTPAVQNIRYVRGAHDAAIVEENWDGIADFVLSGDDPASRLPESLARRRAHSMVLTVASIFAVPIACFVIWLVYHLGLASVGGLDQDTLKRIVGFGIAALVVGTVVTRF